MTSRQKFDPLTPDENRSPMVLWGILIAVLATLVWTASFIFWGGAEEVAPQPEARHAVPSSESKESSVEPATTDAMSDRELLIARYPTAAEAKPLESNGTRVPGYFQYEKPSPNEPNQDIFELTLHARGMWLAFSPDSKQVAATVGTEVRVWDIATGKRLWTSNKDRVRLLAVTFSPDGKTVVTGGYEGVIRFWNTETGELVRELFRTGEGVEITELVMTRDGKSLVCGVIGKPGLVEVWNVADQVMKGSLRTANTWPSRLLLSPDGTKLLATSYSGADGRLQVWSFPELQPLFTSESNRVRIALFHPHLPELIVGEAPIATARGWRFQTSDWTPVAEAPDINGGKSAISPDGRYLARSFGRGEISLVDLTTNQAVSRQPMIHLVRMSQLQFSPDPKNYVLGSIGYEGLVKLWNPETGELIRRLE